ncbi:twin-arginine translocation signal domain-containing protein [Photobacterium damselae]|uniref:twin-arginine translocation signal domain-containing protein n=1 Tax=Photobacterium damselae TaxID=38293 RepID=UPI001485602E|nr:twin-arginine translocation signal domain-containing protein [Photobacterium damselae]
MLLKRRNFLKSGLAGTAGVILSSPVSAFPRFSVSQDTNTVTLSFCGTSCTRDEGEVSRSDSNKDIYLPSTGYIPVRLMKELGGLGVSVRGVGQNDWAMNGTSEKLHVAGPLKASPKLLSYIQSYISGDQYSLIEAARGSSMPALALHGANIAAASKAETINMIGHSRGACEAIMAAWFLYAYGDEAVRNTPVNIFAIEPVPGPGEWYGLLTQLPPNVVNYVGIYAWDMCGSKTDHAFQAVVPRPNGRMRGENNDIELHNQSWRNWFKGQSDWSVMADDAQQKDPLAPDDTAPQPQGYELYVCRGRHSTMAGNTTADAQYDPAKDSTNVAPAPELIYKVARGYLTQWGSQFKVPCAVKEDVLELRQHIHRFHREFDMMGGGYIRTSSLPNRPYVRRVSSIYGYNPLNNYYLEDVVGMPPYKLSYPLTSERQGKGWVDWKFL